jgi:calmodulin
MPPPVTLSEAAKKEAQEAFVLFDKDSAGSIPTKDLGLVLRSLGYSLSAAQLKELEQKADPSRSGCIKLAAFMVQLTAAESFARESSAAAKKSLKQLAVGVQQLLEGKTPTEAVMADSISLEDFKRIMTRIGERVSQTEFTEICKDLEVENDRVKIDTLIKFLNLE